MSDFWDPRTWPDAYLAEYAARKYTCDIERTMIPAAQEELRRRTAAGIVRAMGRAEEIIESEEEEGRALIRLRDAIDASSPGHSD
jgi:hypothetical protein